MPRIRAGEPSKTGKRTDAILVKVTKAEKQRLKRASAKKGYGVSTMLRALGLELAERRKTK
jgi:hypothetical protein